MRYFATTENQCKAVCQDCLKGIANEGLEGWSELNPETLEGMEPTQCALCGEALDLLA
jgi:hypothetical protein